MVWLDCSSIVGCDKALSHAHIKVHTKEALPMKASILAIGTEITNGQIINRNAQTIAKNISQKGLSFSYHLSVPDDRLLIKQALDFISRESEIIFVCGGLGPTSDDFTRDVVSDWANKELMFSEESWTYITERLTERGLAVREHQKQQCYFPKNALILKNSKGTAHGFYFETEHATGLKKIFVLPGPPSEIQAIWQDHIENWLAENLKVADPLITKVWDTMGVPEPELAFRVEKILSDVSVQSRLDGGLDIGYRVHLPYVELKFIFPKSMEAKWTKHIKLIDQALDSITVSRDFQDILKDVFVSLSDQQFVFYDYFSDGYWLERLTPYLKKQPNFLYSQGADAPNSDFFLDETNFLALLPYEEDKAIALFDHPGKAGRKTGQLILEFPFKSKAMEDRRKIFLSEMALVDFFRQFASLK